ncbi:hypothetical protein [Alkalibacillus almallahensis]|uniref:hypothetical protein n=1 Tax=Alkalibacillus almallahensis TaxID=1379154 RepID=UPI00142265CC|nr:hypothetical protein [Alkalibacillus almallahensis]NIK10924.1 hypothetical protein [Alkalibacillus almallahensis]
MENRLIFDALSPISVPIAYQEYRGSESTYIRFFYLPKVGFNADNDSQYSTNHIQIDVFTPYDPTSLASDVKEYMKLAGFKKNFEHENYETDTKLFHYILRFWIIKEEI